MQEVDKEEIFSQSSLDSFELANKNRFNISEADYDDLKIKLVISDKEEEVQPVQTFIDQEPSCAAPSGEPTHYDNHNIDACKEEVKENKVIYISSTSETSSTHQNKKRKNKSSREVEPNNFLSLKRKDVIFKSIFRMMRRFFCKLLEENTEYDRKEKCINTKHQQLIKYISIGMEKLGFNSFAKKYAILFCSICLSKCYT